MLETLRIPDKWKKSLELLPQDTVLNSTEFNGLLDRHLPLLGSQMRKRILEAAAIAFLSSAKGVASHQDSPM
ncbi:hypothetical protein [Okeania sp. KiyG1]|uniref:hypothetical protein n=1 Tax=Okeania sp. KiyG1 TaxID=2720165 RepID=UPI001922F36E|nr:hypothetical protein [Okeania sp. KiyG1]GGA27358.1 hypothetical protein CYANOKiyG1_43530 [Okeania sp. KiyG1]